MDFPFPTEVTAFIVWLGGNTAGGVIVSLVLERIQAYKDWKSPAKGWLTAGLFVALPFISTGLQALLASLPAETVAQVNHYLALAFAGLTAWGVSQFAHKADPAA